MTPERNRAGAVVVKFDDETDMQLAIHAIRMGKKQMAKNGKVVPLDHSKADAVVALVKQALGSRNVKDKADCMPGVDRDVRGSTEDKGVVR